MPSIDDTTALVRRDEDQGLVMSVSPAEAHRRMQELQAFVQSTMVRNIDYGVIHGTDKPTLLQPGAQKLAEVYGLGHRFVPVESVKDWERGFFYFEYSCQIFSRRDGRDICEGIGSCNSKESKYGERWVFENAIPAGLDRASLTTKSGVSKKTGRSFTLFRVPNPDPYSLVNTLQKMAAKRAYIHAVISATRSSGILTQDVEDLPPDAFGVPEQSRSWEHDAETGEVMEPTAKDMARLAHPPIRVIPDADLVTPAPPVHVVSDKAGPQNGGQCFAPALAQLERYAFHEAALLRAKTLDELRVAWDTVCDDGKRQRISLDQQANLREQKNGKGRAFKAAEKERLSAATAELAKSLEVGAEDPWALAEPSGGPP